MNFLFRVVVVLSLVTFFTGSAYALSEQDLIQSSGGLGSYGGLSSTGSSSVGTTGGKLDSGTTGLGLEQGSPVSGASGTGNDEKLYNRLLEKMKEEESGLPAGEAQTRSILERARKSTIILTAEPGDGLATLSWQLIGVNQNAEDVPMKFALYVGTESGQYVRKIDIGSADHFILRGLTNNQVYYLRLMGYSGDSTILSKEVKVTPLPQEQMSSELEKSFAKKTVTMQDRVENDPLKRDLKQFGYDFFKNSSTMLQTVENAPVGNDYVIGPGDTLQIDIWGSIDARYQVAVDRNGEITIPKVGVVKVWGLSYGQAKEAINKAIGRYFKGYNLNITLGKLRTIQVFVVGAVENPGVYSVSSLATVINALSTAGGPSKNGSLRDIRLLKGGKVTEHIDLYDIFLSGDRSKDIRLENGDTIFVPVIGRVAAVAGEVKRPGIYELKDGVTLTQVLAMAGGITAAGNTGRIQVERFEGNSGRVILDYQLKEGKAEKNLDDVIIQDRDMVKVFPVSQFMRQVVKLTGNVINPGEYEFKPGMRVSDLIHGFSSILPDSYTEAAEITRLVLPDRHREVVTFNLAKALQGDEKENLLLQEQDTVHVFSRWSMQERPVVSITGQVVSPGTYDYYPHMTIRDLIAASGSLKRNAFMGSAELTRVVTDKGKAKSERVNVNLSKVLAGDPGQNLELKPDDAFIVRGVEDWLEASDRFVVLKGEVKFPGAYSISKGEKLSSVIARAGGFTDRAYLKGAKFTRKSVQELQQKRMTEVLEKAELDIMQKQGELASVAASKEEARCHQGFP